MKKAFLKGLKSSPFFKPHDLLQENNGILKFILEYNLIQCNVAPTGKKLETLFVLF